MGEFECSSLRCHVTMRKCVNMRKNHTTKMDDCCGSCWKKLVIAFNTIFLICGLALLGAGIYFQLTLEGFSAILGNENINPGTLLIIIGGITVIIAFFGCVGACCENRCGACMLKTFGSLVALLLLIEVILVVV